jgi:tRNA G26 N,N-dimethylase Trm1
MAILTLRTVKGTTLTHQELDDNLTNLNSFKVEGRSGSLISTASTPNQILDSVAASSVRTLRYIVQVVNSVTNEFHATSLMIIHDGTTVFLTEYATVLTGASLASFDADISSGNLRILVSPTYESTTVFRFSAMTIES